MFIFPWTPAKGREHKFQVIFFLQYRYIFLWRISYVMIKPINLLPQISFRHFILRCLSSRACMLKVVYFLYISREFNLCPNLSSWFILYELCKNSGKKKSFFLKLIMNCKLSLLMIKYKQHFSILIFCSRFFFNLEHFFNSCREIKDGTVWWHH